jgi:hypothetical protein
MDAARGSQGRGRSAGVSPVPGWPHPREFTGDGQDARAPASMRPYLAVTTNTKASSHKPDENRPTSAEEGRGRSAGVSPVPRLTASA